jgi:phospholipid/cholesterol/gamma-HCH transport system substrate-binding protein
MKGAVYLTLQPNPDKYYIVGAVSDPIQTITTKTFVTDSSSVTTQEIKREITFTAQFARRWRDLALRLGLTQNTFGFGSDYFLYNDKLKITADIWDFLNQEQSNKHPHLTAGLDYFLNKNLFISGGGDDLLNKSWRSFYLGGGIKFEDEDLKYLFSAAPKP